MAFPLYSELWRARVESSSPLTRTKKSRTPIGVLLFFVQITGFVESHLPLRFRASEMLTKSARKGHRAEMAFPLYSELWRARVERSILRKKPTPIWR